MSHSKQKKKRGKKKKSLCDDGPVQPPESWGGEKSSNLLVHSSFKLQAKPFYMFKAGPERRAHAHK